jgi:hypothetical protein
MYYETNSLTIFVKRLLWLDINRFEGITWESFFDGQLYMIIVKERELQDTGDIN